MIVSPISGGMRRGMSGLSPRKGGGAIDPLALAPAGQNNRILIVSDSLGVLGSHGNLFGQFFTYLAGQSASQGVTYSAWNISTNDYDAATVVQAGAGTFTTTIDHFAIGGSQGARVITEQVKALRATPQVVLFNHGKNISSEQAPDGRYMAVVEMLRLLYPLATFVHILEPPNRDDTAMTAMVAAVSRVATQYGDPVIDCHASWIAAGKPSGYYDDNLHPSTAGVTALYLPNLITGWTAARKTTHPAWLATQGSNLLLNGDFAVFTGSYPTSWTGAGIPATATKDTVFKEAGRPWSCKLSAATAQAQMRQTFSALPGATITAMQGQYIWFAVRQWVPQGSTATPGLAQLTIVDNIGTLNLSTQHTSDLSGFNQPNGQWHWSIGITQRALGTTITAASSNLKLYCNSAAGVTSNADVWFDRVIMNVGQIPNDMAFAVG